MKSAPDFVNYRLLLWKVVFGLCGVSSLSKIRPVLAFFYRKEYKKNNSLVATKWNIKQNSVQEDGDRDEGYEDEVNQSKDERTISSKPKTGKSTLKYVCRYGSIFI
mgnify:CR=1 FL=1